VLLSAVLLYAVLLAFGLSWLVPSGKNRSPAIDWFTDAVRNKTVYVSQGRLEIK
jgi:hypothetical protein